MRKNPMSKIVPNGLPHSFCETPIFGDVTAIITAMTDGEQPFLAQTMAAVLADREIAQVIVCIEERNTWIDSCLGAMIADRRLEILRLPIALPGAIRNQGVHHARHPWVAYCDGDDVWCPDKTRRQREYAVATGADLVGVDHYLTSENGQIRGFGQSRHLPMTSAWLVRTASMQSHPFNESLAQGEDGEWWVRTRLTVTKVRCAEMQLCYRVRRHSLSSNTVSKRRKAQFVALASIPVMGPVIGGLALLVTSLAWRRSRQPHYDWLDTWNLEDGPRTLTISTAQF
jgi:Glycosyl transferase family 2